LQRAPDAEVLALLARMNEIRTGVVAKVQGLLVLAIRDNFSGELSSMVPDLWAVRSFAHTMQPQFETLLAQAHVKVSAQGTLSNFSRVVSLDEIDRLLQSAEILARDRDPITAIGKLDIAAEMLSSGQPSAEAFAIGERARKLSEHLMAAPSALKVSGLLVAWTHQKPSAEMRIARKYAEALIANMRATEALEILAAAKKIVSVDLHARSARAEALLALGDFSSAIIEFERVVKLDPSTYSAASTRAQAGLAAAFARAGAYRRARRAVETGIFALEQRIIRRGNQPVRAMRMAKLLDLEWRLDRLSEQPVARATSALRVLEDAISIFGPVPALVDYKAAFEAIRGLEAR